eukprot:112571-Rhodomonas_salina.1
MGNAAIGRAVGTSYSTDGRYNHWSLLRLYQGERCFSAHSLPRSMVDFANSSPEFPYPPETP